MLLRIATRKSQLALWQTEHVAARLRALDPALPVELVPLSTRGDEVLDRSLSAIGGKGLFLKELELALERGEADIAVHSLKDVPVDRLDAGLTGGHPRARGPGRRLCQQHPRRSRRVAARRHRRHLVAAPPCADEGTTPGSAGARSARQRQHAPGQARRR